MNNSTKKHIINHLNACNNSFIPNLDSYVDINSYSRKIYSKSTRFEHFENNKLIGLVASYQNPIEREAFITNVSVIPSFQKKGISYSLLSKCISYYKDKKYKLIALEVNNKNWKAVNFYEKNKFKIVRIIKNKIVMELKLERDYNQEFLDTDDHKYAYNFDFDVMHPYMIKSFIPHFVKGNCLELGSFKGDFTKRLTPHFQDITCVEISSEAISEAKSKILDQPIKWVEGRFEDINLPTKYDNIILTHVLEHIDDPIRLLEKINNKWLSKDGKLFIVVPNANAPSRQIAVKMGLISNNTSITPSEKEHGHVITYTLDMLEGHAQKGGLDVTNRSGIFFKALANFQWDQLLNTDIISKEYLDGCYALGHQYPDLCSSIMLVCKKG
jgi:2-polyprenyl-3-methyl-5-hydroxy-6-metoxy-1,4-benzoquinol methylase